MVIVLSISAPILAALQTFLRFPERAEQHRTAAVRFGKLKRDVETLLVFPPSDVAALESKMKDLEKADTQIRQDAPSCGTLALRAARKKIVAESTDALTNRLVEKYNRGTETPSPKTDLSSHAGAA